MINIFKYSRNQKVSFEQSVTYHFIAPLYLNASLNWLLIAILALVSIFAPSSLAAPSPLQAQEPPGNPSRPETGVVSGNLAASERRSASALLQETVQRLQQSQYQAALQSIGNYQLLYPGHYRSRESNFYRAIALYHLNQVQEARTGFNALLASAPDEARRFGVFYWLGLCSYRLGEADTAYDIWLRQLAVRETGAADYIQQTYFGLAQLLTERGDEELALRYFRLLQGRIKRRAGFAHGYLALKHALYQEAYNAFSAYLIQENIEGGPSRSQALFYQGQAAFFAGLLDQAKQSLDTVLRLYDNRERLFLAALIMRLRIAVAKGDRETAGRFYSEATALEQRYNHGLQDWLSESELPLFILQGYYPLAKKHLRAKLQQARGRTEREIARFNLALVEAFLDVRYAVRKLQKLENSFIQGIAERALFHAARLQISFPLTRAEGLAEMEHYLKQYPQGRYRHQAVKILLTVYRSDPERFWLEGSILLASETENPLWPEKERARFHLYWAEMARQLGNDHAALSHLHQSWKLAPKELVGLQAYYRSGALYFGQRQYSRALGYFREVQLQLSERQFASAQVRAEAAELNFYAQLSMAQAYAGAGQPREALRQFEQLIAQSQEARLGRNVEEVQLQLGLAYFYQKAYKQAVETFDLIIAKGVFPSNQASIPSDQYSPALLALYWKGEALFRQGLFAAARQSFRRANEIYPEALGANAYLRAALAAKAAEDYESAIQDLQQAQSFVGGNLPQLLNVDFNLIKFNLLLGRDAEALKTAQHMLKSVPPAYNFLGEAFMEVAEFYFNRGDIQRSKAILDLLEQEFIRKLPPRESQERQHLELFLEEQKQDLPHTQGLIAQGLIVDGALLANLKDRLFSFDTEQFLRRYSRKLASSLPGDAPAVDQNIQFYIGDDDNIEHAALSNSVFSALYLQGIIYAQEKDHWKACEYFLQYLRKDPFGPYAISAVSSVLRLIPELNSRHRQLYKSLKGAHLGDALGSILFVRYWSLQEDNAAKKRQLEKIIRQTLSINARKEAMYHLSIYYRRQGNIERAQELLLNLRNIKGGNLALDPENYWAGLANLELGRTAYRKNDFTSAKTFFKAIVNQAQVERETLAEALYWLASIAHFEGNAKEEQRYRQSLQNLAPDSEWLRKLG